MSVPDNTANRSRMLLRKALDDNRADLLIAAAAEALGIAVADVLASQPDRKKEEERLRRVFGNAVLLGLIFALVPALIQLTKPWWVAGLGGWFAGILGGVWVMITFVVDSAVKKKIEDWLARQRVTSVLVAVLVIVLLAFGIMYAVQPRPDDPVICIVTTSRDPQLRSDLEHAMIRVQIGDASETVSGPGNNVLLVGLGDQRVDWLTGDAKLFNRLTTLAKNDVGPYPDALKLDEAIETLVSDWTQEPKRVMLQPKLGDTLVVEVSGNPTRTLRRQRVTQKGLQLVVIGGGTR